MGVFPPRSIRPRVVALGAVAIAALLLLPHLGTLPGLHGDEAWAGIQAHQILHGARPLTGMNGYTGPLQQYLIAGFFYFLGCNVFALRLLTVIATLISVFLYHHIVRRWAGEATANFSAFLLVSLPFFIAYGRIAHEVFALNPILALGAGALLSECGGENWRRRMLYPALAGVLLGLGVWNHAIFASLVMALLVVAFSRHRFSFLRSRIFHAACMGFFLALSPRIFWQFSPANSASGASGHGDVFDFLGNFGQRLWEWPMLFPRLLHGDLLFQRYTGQVAFPTFGVIWFFLLAGVYLVLRDARQKQAGLRSKARELLIFSLALFFFTALLCPANSDRYFLLILYLVPLFAARFFAEGWKPPEFRGAIVFLFCVFVSFQLVRVWCNFYAPQLGLRQTGSIYSLGSNLETNNHFLRSDRLYQLLLDHKAKRIYAEFFIAWPVRFYDLDRHALDSVEVIDSGQQLANARHAGLRISPETYAVVYSAGLRRVQPEQYCEFESVDNDAGFLLLQPKSSPQIRRQQSIYLQPWTARPVAQDSILLVK